MAASQKDVQIARDLYAELRGVTSELKGQETEITKSRKAFRAFEDAAQKFKLNQEEISKLNDKELGDLQKKLVSQLAIAKYEGDALKNALTDKNLIQGKVDEIKKEIKLNKEGLSVEEQALEQSARINDLVHESIKNKEELTEEQKALIAASFDEYQVIQDINGEMEKELAIRKKANKLLGVSGNILKGLKQLGPFAEAFKLDQVADDMDKAADEAVRLNKSFGKTRVLIAGIKSAGKGLIETVSDPTVLTAALVKGFKEVDSANVEFQKSTGQSLNTVKSSMATAGNQFVTLGDYIKTASQLTKELGQDA